MKIEDNRLVTKETIFREIPAGEAFEYQGLVYIHGTNSGSCTRLDSGKHVEMAAGYKVTHLPNVKLVIDD